MSEVFSSESWNLLIVEDDFQYEEMLLRKLKRAFPNGVFNTKSTEFSFRKMVPELRKEPPSAIIMDIMLPWESPKPNPEPRPPDVESEGLLSAGFRCQRFLNGENPVNPIPVILYSALPEVEIQELLRGIPSYVKYLSKHEINKLPGLILELIEANDA